MKTTDRVMAKVGLPLIAAAGFLLVIAFVLSIKTTNKENNAYIRVINCIISENAVSRTQSDIEACYSSVEGQLHVKLQRYDNSNK